MYQANDCLISAQLKKASNWRGNDIFTTRNLKFTTQMKSQFLSQNKLHVGPHFSHAKKADESGNKTKQTVSTIHSI